MRTTALIRATGLTAALGSLAFAVPAQAVTTVGNNLAATPTAGLTLCQGDLGCTLVPATLDATKAAPGGLVVPASGVVVRWRVKSGAAASTSIQLRVVRGNMGVSRSAPQSLTSAAVQTFTFPVRLAVFGGDRLGVDLIVRGPDNPAIAAPAPLLASFDRWEPVLANGETRPPEDLQHYELLLQADIEVDNDSDGFGDETQDGCLGEAGPQGGCPVPPPPPPPPPPPAPASSPPPPPAGTSSPPPPPSGGTAPTAPTDSIAPPDAVNAAPRVTALQFNATRVSFRISEPASVSLLVQRVLPGKRAGARCVKPTRRNRAARNCTRLVRAVTGRTNVESGLNTARLRRLPAGRYRVRLLSTDLSGRTGTVIRYFRIGA